MLTEQYGRLALPVRVKNSGVQMTPLHIVKRLAGMKVHRSRGAHRSRTRREDRLLAALASQVAGLHRVEKHRDCFAEVGVNCQILLSAGLNRFDVLIDE